MAVVIFNGIMMIQMLRVALQTNKRFAVAAKISNKLFRMSLASKILIVLKIFILLSELFYFLSLLL
jgi:hypothetical protein